MKVNGKYKRNFLADFLMIIIILLIFVLVPLGYTPTLHNSFANALFILAFGILITYLKTKFLLDCTSIDDKIKVSYYNNMGIERNVLLSNDSRFYIIRRNTIFGKKTLIRVINGYNINTFEVLDEMIIEKIPKSNLETFYDTKSTQ